MQFRVYARQEGYFSGQRERSGPNKRLHLYGRIQGFT
jgi:hypothetical protein